MARFVNADPNSASLDLWFGDQKAFAQTQSGTATQYIEVPSERREFRLRPAGNDTTEPLVTNSEGLGAGKHYTIVATRKENNKLDLKVLNDDSTAPATDKVKLRVVNAASRFGEVDVARPGDKNTVFSGVNVDSATSYKDVDPPANGLEVRKKGQTHATVRVPVGLVAGRMYTLILTSSGGANRIEVLKLEDGGARS